MGDSYRSVHKRVARRAGGFGIAVLAVLLLSGCAHRTARRVSKSFQAVDLGDDPAENLVWNPAHNWIAYERVRHPGTQAEQRRIEVMDMDAGRSLFTSTGPSAVEPVWAPDGAALVDSQWTADGGARLHSVPLGSPGKPETQAGQGFSLPGRQGQTWWKGQLLLSHDDKTSATMRLEAWDVVHNKTTVLWPGRRNVIFPAASPDGRFIAGISVSGGRRAVVVFSAGDGRIIYRSQSGIERVFDVAWVRKSGSWASSRAGSSDWPASFLLYEVASADGDTLHRVSFPGRTDTVLCHAWGLDHVAVRADSIVAIGMRDDSKTHRIRILDAQTGATVSESPADVTCDKPAWSSDGRLAMLTHDANGFHIRVVDPAGWHGVHVPTELSQAESGRKS
jgi:hypothetical protein